MLRLNHRGAVVSLALLTLLVVFVGASTGAHRHDNTSRDACQVCHVAHGPALEADSFIPHAPLACVSRSAFPADFIFRLEPLSALSPARAPPA